MKATVYARLYWKHWAIALSAAALGILFLSALGGCSAIEGAGRDLSDMAGATREAMKQE
ncbi:MAG: hypothetical protein JKY67_00005 [Pseudomonadales bacterium]|nr:hypothetical protein [Pseudomonadales bacterium]